MAPRFIGARMEGGPSLGQASFQPGLGYGPNNMISVLFGLHCSWLSMTQPKTALIQFEKATLQNSELPS